jgi:hypothetical protein
VKALAAALVAAQKAMPAVKKDATNPHYRSRFTSLDHLIATTKPVLAEHGLVVLQFPAFSETGQPALRTTLLHESGESLSEVMPLFLPKQDPQGQGSALSYAKRYAWASVLGISSEEDDDGERASSEGGSSEAARPTGTGRNEPVASPSEGAPLPETLQFEYDDEAGELREELLSLAPSAAQRQAAEEAIESHRVHGINLTLHKAWLREAIAKRKPKQESFADRIPEKAKA